MKSEKTSLEEIKKKKQKKISINFKRFGQMITHPRRAFLEIEEENKKAEWKTPIIIVGVLILMVSILSAVSPISSANASAFPDSSNFNFGGVPGERPDSMPSMGTENDIDESTVATEVIGRSPSILTIVFSVIGSATGFLLTWLFLGILSNMLSISFGGQGNTKMAIVFAAWTNIPGGVRAIMQTIYILATATSINAAGLSGFAPGTETPLAIFMEKLLTQIDIYIIWQAILLVIGISVMTKLNKKKSIIISILSILIIVLTKSLIGMGFEQLAGLGTSNRFLNRMIR